MTICFACDRKVKRPTLADTRSALKIRKDVIAMTEQHTPGYSNAAQIQMAVDAHHAEFVALKAERDRLRAVNAELVAALTSVHRSLNRVGATGDARIDDAQDTARAALAKAKE